MGIENAKDKLVGKAKEAAGAATDNKRLENEGKGQAAAGEAKQKAENAANEVKDKAHEALGNLKD